VLPTGERAGTEGAAGVAGVAEAAEGVGEDGVVEADAGGVSGADDCGRPVREMEEASAGSGLGGLAEQAFAFDAGDGVGDFDGACFEVDLGPEDGESFADADAGAEHERDEVGEVGLYGVVVGGKMLAQEGDFFATEGAGGFLGWDSMASTSRTGLTEVAP
jgi:hypothetical protein